MRRLEITKERLLANTRQEGDCLVWTGSTRAHRYGVIKHCGKTIAAHRASYELHVRAIPDGQVVMHTCDTPLCINPSHLVLGTQADNVRDMWRKGRQRILARENHPNAKLTRDQVSEIRRRFKPYDRRNSARAMAKEFGVTHQCVTAITRGEAWK